MWRCLRETSPISGSSDFVTDFRYFQILVAIEALTKNNCTLILSFCLKNKIHYSKAEVDLSTLLWVLLTYFVVTTLERTAKQIWFWYLKGLFCSNAQFFFLLAILHNLNLKVETAKSDFLKKVDIEMFENFYDIKIAWQPINYLLIWQVALFF